MRKIYTLTVRQLFILCIIILGGKVAAQPVKTVEAEGYELFKSNCSSCHKMDEILTGPALRGVEARLAEEQGLGKDWIYAWVKNNEAVRASGDAYANKIFQEFNGEVMNPFPDLTDQDIDKILAYTANPEKGEADLDQYKKEVKAEKEAAAKAAQGGGGGGAPMGVLVVGFAVLAVLLLWILLRMNALVKLSQDEQLVKESAGFDMAQFLEKNQKYLQAAMGILLLFALYGLWNFLLGIGVDEGYQPEQPIYFSHKIHAGDQGIDCQYCHSSAKYSKVSGIPSLNVCMNCHKSINEYNGEYEEGDGKDAEFYTQQIGKLFEHTGFDPKSGKYTDSAKTIQWVRIHNMPDFVYFNHSRHVVEGEAAIKKAIADGTIPNSENLDPNKDNSQVCFACHGRVDQMDEVKMANKFTMGWCIECHRTTEVDMGRAYNQTNYAKIHEELKKQYGDKADKGKLTVDAIGGIECGKCHY